MKKIVTNVASFIAIILVVVASVVFLNYTNRPESISMTDTDISSKASSLSISAAASQTTALSPALAGSATAPAYTFPMDINNADRDALLFADGIGETLADRIISYREAVGAVKRMDELLAVSGIGEAKLASLKRLFYAPDDNSPEKTVSSSVTATPSMTSSAPETTTPYPASSAPETTAPSTTKKPAIRQKVSINTASAEELERCLLISKEQAEEIVSLREEIGGYVNILEILYCESISDELYLEIDEYLTL